VRVEFDPGVAAPRHTHYGEEVIYVLKGTVRYDIDGQGQKTAKRGDVLFVPAGTAHSATNVGSAKGAEIATYIVAKGKPLTMLVK
jgi:quercetin dioxygenase-like cupin family protein